LADFADDKNSLGWFDAADFEPGAAGRGVGDADRPAVGLGDFGDDGQADARPVLEDVLAAHLDLTPGSDLTLSDD
jgi:hypothetical protein